MTYIRKGYTHKGYTRKGHTYKRTHTEGYTLGRGVYTKGHTYIRMRHIHERAYKQRDTHGGIYTLHGGDILTYICTKGHKHGGTYKRSDLHTTRPTFNHKLFYETMIQVIKLL